MRGSRDKKSRNRGSGQLSLRDEAAGAANLDAATVVGTVTARREDDHRPVCELAQLLGDLKAVDVRKLHVEENEVGL